MDCIRILKWPDIPVLLALSRLAGWNQTEADWLRLMHLAPDGCFGLEREGRLVATSSAICYGATLAWVGMVLTHPELRGRGYGSRMTAAAVEHARNRGVRCVGLDATDMGHPVYVRLGFRDQGPIERWTGAAPAAVQDAAPAAVQGAAPGAPPHYRALDPAALHLDRAAFGADRSTLLEALATAQRASAADGGYAMARPGGRALQLGPCVARSPETARLLVRAILSRRPGEPFFWDLLPSNASAVGLAKELRFAPARRLTRMLLAAPGGLPSLERDDTLVYATAGFEYG